MVFSSIGFLFYFLPLFLFAYIVLASYRNLLLLLFSLIFYAYGEPVYLLLLIFSSVLAFGISHLMSKSEKKKRSCLLIAGIMTNVIILAFFKYGDFIIEIINSLFSARFSPLKIALPVGISFYTFQIMSYLIDVYRKKVEANPSLLDFMMYVSMFPQLIAGPIVRYADIESSLTDRKFSLENLSRGSQRFTAGLAKKLLLADNLNLMYLALISCQNSQIGSIIAYIAYGLHIYYDFSAYSDMAIGLGRMLGFSFLENFNYPYVSKSISEFFRRWHISLGTWFRDYIYIPMGGSRSSKPKVIINLFLVWFITGLWHGAGINYILWGLFLGSFVILEKIFSYTPESGLISHLYVLSIMTISWVFFANDSISGIQMTFRTFLGIGSETINSYTLFQIRNYLPVLLISLSFATPYPEKALSQLPAPLKNILLMVLLLVCIAEISFVDLSPFIYFRF